MLFPLQASSLVAGRIAIRKLLRAENLFNGTNPTAVRSYINTVRSLRQVRWKYEIQPDGPRRLLRPVPPGTIDQIPTKVVQGR